MYLLSNPELDIKNNNINNNNNIYFFLNDLKINENNFILLYIIVEVITF